MNYSIKLNPNNRNLIIGEKHVYLGSKEYDLMHYFLQNTGKLLTRTELLEEVWDRNIFCTTNTVDVHISKLRKKIGLPKNKSPIKTVPCLGYLFEK